LSSIKRANLHEEKLMTHRVFPMMLELLEIDPTDK